MKQSFDARRGFLKTATVAGLALSATAQTLAAARKAALDGDPWQAAAGIAKRLAKPVKFRKADYLVTDFGAGRASCAREGMGLVRRAGRPADAGAGFAGLLPRDPGPRSRPATRRAAAAS
jgi:hypothetical protein